MNHERPDKTDAECLEQEFLTSWRSGGKKTWSGRCASTKRKTEDGPIPLRHRPLDAL
jgi:hypothetical protein